MGKVARTGRPKEEEYWGRVTVLEGRRVKCNDCGYEFAASANRIKSHVDRIKGKGIRACTGKPKSSNDLGHNLLRSHATQQNKSRGPSKRKITGNTVEKWMDKVKNRNQSIIRDVQNEAGQLQANDADEDKERIHVVVSNRGNEDLLVKRYVCECLRPEDKVFISPSLYLTQKEFITLKPGTYLDSWVIDIFVEILTDCEKKKATPSNWYLPVTFSTAALGYDERRIPDFVLMQKFKENYIFDQESPEKVFIPVHVGSNECGHFYLYILHLNNSVIEIWDSLPTYVGETKRAEITKKLLFAMEILFEKRRKFLNYRTEVANDILLQPNEFDCGVFVINYMQQSDNYVKIDTDPFQFDSQKEREDLALTLLTNDLNQEKQNLYQNARRHYEQVENQEGNKRLRVDRVNKHDGLEKGSCKAYLLPTTDLIGKNFQRYAQQIRGWINDDKVSAIGVWGMGGSGKTALAIHIYDKLLEEAETEVIWVTVSQNSISHLQKVIARSIKLNISHEFEVRIIARKLLQAFRDIEKRVVIILDDVWDLFSLKEVGFPMSSSNQITLILTTRIWNVCQGMDCKTENIIKVESLDFEDSFSLFKKFMEVHDGTWYLEMEKIAWDLSYACMGLPLAIVRIATSMKGKTYFRDWSSHMLDRFEYLSIMQYEIDKWVLPILRSSYDFLTNILQNFFLYYVLNTAKSFDDEDADHLIRRFSYESIDETKLMVSYSEGYKMLDELQNHGLLLEGKEEDEKPWNIHWLVRILAIRIIAEDRKQTMAKAYKNLTEIPSDNQWKADLQEVFLAGNKIQKIPDGMNPRCSQLSTLILDRNENLNYIPNDFFNNMPILKTLDLSHTSIKSLPESVSRLKCLIALLLSGCKELSFIPSVSELKRLIALDLSHTAIKEAPTGLEALVKLRCLYLLGTDAKMSASIISKLINLEWLELGWIIGLGVIESLEKLEVIVADFNDIGIFNSSMNYLDKTYALRGFDLTLVGAKHVPGYFKQRYRLHDVKRITFRDFDLGNGEAILPGDIKELFIKHCKQMIGDRDLCKFISYECDNCPHQIELLNINDCDGVEYLCCLSGRCPFCSSSRLVGGLHLIDLKNLKYLVSPFAFLSLHESFLFSHLAYLYIRGCHSMKSVMTPKLLALLRNLRTIEIDGCEGMEEIIREDHSQTESTTSGKHFHPHVTLPNLTSMHLWGMPQLNYVYRGFLLCPSLRTFSAHVNCEQLDSPQIKISSDGCLLPMDETQSRYRYHWKIESD